MNIKDNVITAEQPIHLEQKPQKLTNILLYVLAPFALAHFISYLYRTINAVVYPELTTDLNLSANSLGLLTSAYFITFAIAQIPVGVALDRYGPRKVQTPMLMIAALGALLFSQAATVNELMIARGLIGFGVAGSLMAAIKASSLWFPIEKLSLSTSILLAVGGMGAMASTSPMHYALEQTTWRNIFIALSLATLMVSAIIFFVVPESPKKQQTKISDMFKAVGQLYSSRSFWRIVLYTLLAHATYMAIQGLWMGSWLRDVGGLSRSEAAEVLFFGTVAMVAGSLTFGWLTDVLRKRGYSPVLTCGAGVSIFLIFQFLMICGLPINPWLVAIGFSFFGTATTMNYAIVAQSVPTHLTGRVSTSFNLIVFLLAFIVQWGIGVIINQWETQLSMYPKQAYQVALGINLALQIPGVILWLSFRPLKKVA